MDFNTTVFETLSACLDPNPNIRLEAELKLKNLALNPGNYTKFCSFHFKTHIKVL